MSKNKNEFDLNQSRLQIEYWKTHKPYLIQNFEWQWEVEDSESIKDYEYIEIETLEEFMKIIHNYKIGIKFMVKFLDNDYSLLKESKIVLIRNKGVNRNMQFKNNFYIFEYENSDMNELEEIVKCLSKEKKQ